MRAIILREYGAPENLEPANVADPTPVADEVLIRVEAAGVHLVDLGVREGEAFGGAPPVELPAVLGREIVGEVIGLGPEAPAGLLGMRVAAHLANRNGGYAEQVVFPADDVLAIPDEMDAPVALAMTGTGRTAVGILAAAQITAADTVLVLAAAGGLGALLVQEALALGARVIAAAGGPEKLKVVQPFGPDELIDYNVDGWAQTLGSVPTVVLEGVGGRKAQAAVGALAKGGRHVNYGWASGVIVEFIEGWLGERQISTPQVLGPAMMALPGGLRGLQIEALRMAETGRWRPLISGYPLSQAARAHADLAERRTIGKVVLLP